MALWKPVNYKTKKVYRQYGDGINTYLPAFDIGESELTDSLNMCADDYPAIRTRNDRNVLELPATTDEYGIGQRQDTYIHVMDGANWMYALPSAAAWEVLSSTLPKNTGVKFVEYNTENYRYTILAYSCKAGEINYACDGSTTLVSLTSDAPHSKLYTAYKFRVFGIDANGRTLRFSALGDLTDWITSLDAGSIDLTNIPSNVTAITTFNDHIAIWTERSMHELYGNSPTNYEIIQVSDDVGCATNFAYVECKGVLYFMDRNGIYQYTGGMPTKISDKVDKYIKGLNNYTLISAGVNGDKIYFSVCYGSATQNRVLVYDTYKQKWFIEDGNFTHFTNVGGALYALSSTGKIYNCYTTGKTGYDTFTTGGSTEITYSFETKAYNDYRLDNESGVDMMWLNHEGTTVATLNIGYTTDSNSTTFTNFVASTDLTHSTEPVKEQITLPSTVFANVEWYKLQCAGTGHKKLNGLQLDTISYGGVK